MVHASWTMPTSEASTCVLTLTGKLDACKAVELRRMLMTHPHINENIAANALAGASSKGGE